SSRNRPGPLRADDSNRSRDTACFRLTPNSRTPVENERLQLHASTPARLSMIAPEWREGSAGASLRRTNSVTRSFPEAFRDLQSESAAGRATHSTAALSAGFLSAASPAPTASLP